MDNRTEIKGQKELRTEVIENGLCVNCGACVNLCPYQAAYQDKLIIIDPCDRQQGRCYAFCPRTFADLQNLRSIIFPSVEFTPEIGPIRGFYLTRAADPEIRDHGQHGGTVSALLSLALKAGIIEAAVVTQESDTFLPTGAVVRNSLEIKKAGRSKFVASPNLAAFNQVAKSEIEKIGIVATPCQTLAIAKMRQKNYFAKAYHIDKLNLVIGLFCGWALSWRELKELIKKKMPEEKIIGLDIPPSKYQAMEVHTERGIVEIPLEEVLPAVRASCRYCLDMTAEFSDLSVGSARLPEGWEIARGWNQVIVRTARGEELLDLARSRGFLEFREIPAGNLERLKEAAANKKRAALKNIMEKSGSPDNLLYLNNEDPILKEFIETKNME
ncbi:MAG: Coenzyme F420 hydrogenase/dehydrogenase, beta subunit C-terminal domain [Thermodesulfobacteriota bacterium]